MSERTLIFCTAYAAPRHDPYYAWEVRYRIWLEAIRRSSLRFDQVLLVDDGSERLPNWSDVHVLNEGSDLRCDAPAVLFHFNQHIGRRAISDFPGWVRSFFFVSRYAEANDFTRIVHIEADAFLMTERAQAVVNAAQDGWMAFWCRRHDRPESGIQVIAGSALQTYADWASRPVESFAGLVIEKTLPFTRLERDLIGDRYSEDTNGPVPSNADWCMQACPSGGVDYASYFWWMPWLPQALAGSLPPPRSVPSQATTQPIYDHRGVYYLEALREIEAALSPRTYLEIGTHTGESLKQITSDAICIDPRFLITSDVLKLRKNTHFFQGTSDEFFADQRLVERLCPDSIDFAFLDGLHTFEALLSDFIQTERLCNERSVILLHDCLPLNERMAERERRWGADDEPEGIRDFWTGDVWKVVLILKAFRPDLTLHYLDCPPTGLVLCSGLDRHNISLSSRYHKIVAAYADLALSTYGLDRLWGLCPTVDVRQLLSSRVLKRARFSGEAA